MGSYRSARAVLLLIPLLLAGAIACRDGGITVQKPSRPIEAVMSDHTAELMAIEGVVAVGQSKRPDGTPIIRVFIKSDDEVIRKRIPTQIEGHPVEVVVSGEIRAMPGKP